jgi:signal transduction histidine kinase
MVVLIYETARQEAIEHIFPGWPAQYSNLVVWGLVLLLTYGFATFVFGVVERLQTQALTRSRDIATLTAVVEERARLSRELHDGLAQLVAYLLVRLDTVTDLVISNRTKEALVELEGMRTVTNDLYQDVRESISELRTRVSERGLPRTLQDYAEEYEDRHGIDVRLSGEDLTIGLPELVAFQLLRVVQEGLANIRKHAHASHALVAFTQDAGVLTMVIEDDGVGFDPQQVMTNGRQSFGLASMRERVDSLGGQLVIDSHSRAGTRLVVSVPATGRPLQRGNNGQVPVTSR